MGPLLVSGALTGRDPATGEMPADLEAQIANVFARIAEPARQVLAEHLDGGALVHADVIAWVDAPRTDPPKVTAPPRRVPRPH